MSRTYVIAEPGGTAQGDLVTMLSQVDVAAAAGCSAFKSQWTSDAERMCARRRAPEYLQAYRWLQWPREWHTAIERRCAMNGIEYGCSIYLPEDAAAVAPYVKFLKISSFESSDLAMWRALEQFPWVIASTGMSPDMGDWYARTRLTVLQCTSAYPAPPESMNLALLRRLEMRRDTFDGLSDHSDPHATCIGALAVAAGAQVIETHFRLDDCDPSHPDYAVARSPELLAEYVSNIRYAELVLGEGRKAVEPCEAPMLRYKVQA